jgi:hypothetical protein
MATARPRVAIPLTYGLAVRYLVPTGLLEELARVCDPIVAVGWEDPELAARIERAGATAARLPAPQQDHTFRRIERLLAAGHDRRLASPTTTISRRWRRRTQPLWTQPATMLRQARDRAATRRPQDEQRIRAEEQAALPDHTNVAEYASWLTDHRIDAVVSLTPYHRDDQLLLWAASLAGLPTLTTIISFDNPTTRGRMPILGDRVLVWNEANREQIERGYPDLPTGSVRITGAPQFDLHRDPVHILDEGEWRRRMALPADRPVILYGAGPELLLPDEPSLVEAIDEAIASGRIAGRPVVLLRGHPADPVDRWQQFAERRHVVVAPGWGRADGGLAWPSDDEIDVQMSTLAHAAVHVNICSSMAIDGAAFDRPVITPTFVPGAPRSRRRRVRSLYRQEHWQPIARSGGVTAVADEPALVAAIGRALAHPEADRDGRRRLVADLLTFDDGRSSARVAAEVADLLRVADERTAPGPEDAADAT